MLLVPHSPLWQNIEELLQNECPDWHGVKHYVTSIYTYFET